MGNDNGDRCESSGSASTLVACILREVDTANAYTVELAQAVSANDRERIIAIKSELQTCWTNGTNAHGAINRLERLSGRVEVFAREFLRQSCESAHEPLTKLWSFVLHATKASANS